MINRTTKLRWRRRYRRSRQQVGDISQQAESHLERHFFKRTARLLAVRRFLLSWITLVVLLIGVTLIQAYELSGYYQKLTPVPGGSYSEGIVGSYTTSDPLFVNNDVDAAVSRLIFAGLLKYNSANQLVPDLAQSWSVDSKGQNYTVVLKPNLKWQDGTPLTANDVVFTFKTIQNPDVNSPLFSSWQGVDIKALNSRTILFSLPDSLSSFPENLTTGIIPEHLLGNVQPSGFQSVNFNTVDPVGAGPFKWETVQVAETSANTQQQQIGLVANPYYYGGKPDLDRFIINDYPTQGSMIAGFDHQDIDAMAGLDNLPANLVKSSDVFSYNVPLTAEVMTFFNNSGPILSDVKVRQALVEGTNESSIIAGLGYPVIPARSPLLPFQIGYAPKTLQLTTNVAQANQLLTQDGWIMGKDGIRTKSGSPLQFQLFTEDDSEYNYVGQALVKQWKAIGVDAQLASQQSIDFQTTLENRDYDALLYGISIGVDPDVFVYWDSSQASPSAIPGLNFSEYKSTASDESLEGGRITVDPALRAVKYQPFLQNWQNDAPAVALYQPRFLYVVRGHLFNFSPTMFNSAADRYANVSNWMVREVNKTN
ncbi:MAG TPA: peptide ABC transporter substrate-binding protein [Candidatus Saccharimonadales bacterium]|nr:peptide ABC transporter substrate-binding protein [Candidatus Saccharimonadales bacterium]